MTTAIVDSERLEKNCQAYSRRHAKAIAVLKKADGKTHYTEIAKKLVLNKNSVSSFLKDAERLGLATKNGKFYKRVMGVSNYFPKANSKKQNHTTINAIGQLSKAKEKLMARKKNDYATVGTDNTFNKMTSAYMSLYVTENSLRNLIRKVFTAEPNWWSKKVNKGIRDAVQKQQVDYPYDGAKRKDELEYTHLSWLSEIITANWDSFLPYLHERDKNTFRTRVNSAIPSRNSIGHCTPMTGQDLRRVDLRFDDILKMLK